MPREFGFVPGIPGFRALARSCATSSCPGEQPRARCLTGPNPPTLGAVSIARSSAGISSSRRTSSPTTADPANGVNPVSSATNSILGACPKRSRGEVLRARRRLACDFTDKVRSSIAPQHGQTHPAKPPGQTRTR